MRVVLERLESGIGGGKYLGGGRGDCGADCCALMRG